MDKKLAPILFFVLSCFNGGGAGPWIRSGILKIGNLVGEPSDIESKLKLKIIGGVGIVEICGGEGTGWEEVEVEEEEGKEEEEEEEGKEEEEGDDEEEEEKEGCSFSISFP